MDEGPQPPPRKKLTIKPTTAAAVLRAMEARRKEEEAEAAARMASKQQQHYGFQQFAGKSLPGFQGVQYDDSGSRHPHSHDISASVRRSRQVGLGRRLQLENQGVGGSFELREEVQDDDDGDGDGDGDEDEGEDEDKEEGEEEEDLVHGEVEPGMDDEILRELEAEAEQSGQWVVHKGKGGRFVRAEGSSSTVESRKGKGKKAQDLSWQVRGAVAGRPMVGSVIPSFGGHVAKLIWEGGDRVILKCHSRAGLAARLKKWIRSLPPDFQSRLRRTGLHHIPSTMFTHIDAPLISAFVERWQPDTSSFHLPFGEMTIMLHDVWQILHIPIEGSTVHSTTSSADLRGLVAELVGRTVDELKRPSWISGVVELEFITSILHDKDNPSPLQKQLTGIIWLTLGGCLFTDKRGSRLRPADIVEARYDDLVGMFSWGSATLAYLYRQLGMASRASTAGIGGCLTLLQAWIYEYFPCFRPRSRLDVPGAPRARAWSVYTEEKSHDRLRALRKQIDSLTAEDVDWLPYGLDFDPTTVPRTQFRGTIRCRDIIEPYMPDRCIRQLGRLQMIPIDIIYPDSASRPSNPKLYSVKFSASQCESGWRSFPTGSCVNIQLFPKGSEPSAAVKEYLSWYGRHSHPLLLNGAGDVSRLLPDHTATEQWMNRWINATRPILRHRDEYQWDDAKFACLEIEQLLQDWNNVLHKPGAQNE